jgi:hypothetical protein
MGAACFCGIHVFVLCNDCFDRREVQARSRMVTERRAVFFGLESGVGALFLALATCIQNLVRCLQVAGRPKWVQIVPQEAQSKGLRAILARRAAEHRAEAPGSHKMVMSGGWRDHATHGGHPAPCGFISWYLVEVEVEWLHVELAARRGN